MYDAQQAMIERVIAIAQGALAEDWDLFAYVSKEMDIVPTAEDFWEVQNGSDAEAN